MREKIKIKLKSIVNFLKNYTILLIIILFIGTIVLFYFGEKIPNIVFIIQFWTIITVYIVLAVQFKREKEKSQKEKGIAISQIEYLLYYIFDNIEKQSLSELQIETKKIIRNLRSFYSDILSKIHCYFTELSNITIFLDNNTYLVNPVDIKRLERGTSINITNNKKEIDFIIDSLRDLI